MKIPSDPVLRQTFFDDVERVCFASRQERIAFYLKMRQVYLLGIDDVTTTESEKYRKIFAHIDAVKSFLYAQETTKFAIQLGASAEPIHSKRSDRMLQILQDDWHDTDTDLIFGEAVRWSLVYGAMIGKSDWRRNCPNLKLIEPHHFGVYREDVMSIHEQEAMGHKFQMTVSEATARLASHPMAKEILSRATLCPRVRSTEESGQSNIVVSQVNPIVGNVNIDLSQGNKYLPIVPQDFYEGTELWIYDDEIAGFRVVTMLDPGVLVYDRPAHDKSTDKRMYMDGEHPFTPIRPRPMHNYFFGQSEVEMLLSMQKKYNEEIERTEKRLRRAANPPKSAIGFTFDSNELADAWDLKGGIVTSDTPGSSMTIHETEQPTNVGEWRHELDQMFDELSGLPPAMRGLGTPGVRSDVHNRSVVQVGGSRVKNRALLIEDSLDDLATKLVNLRRMFDKKNYVDKDGEHFLCAQFTEDFTAKVDAHSNSPVFVEDQKDVADRAFKAKAITRERYLEMIGAPNLPVLKQELRDIIEPGEARAAQAREQQENAKLLMQAGKGGGDPSKVSALLRTARSTG